MAGTSSRSMVELVQPAYPLPAGAGRGPHYASETNSTSTILLLLRTGLVPEFAARILVSNCRLQECSFFQKFLFRDPETPQILAQENLAQEKGEATALCSHSSIGYPNVWICFTICLTCFTKCLFISPDLDGNRAPERH